MKKNKFCSLLLVISFIIKAMIQPLYGQNAMGDCELVGQHLLRETMDNKLFYSVTNLNDRYLSQAASILKSIQADGHWADIDYADRDNDWSPLLHLERLLALSYCYCAPADKLYQQADVLKAIQAGVDYWFAVQPVCVNWFKNEITKPIHFSTIGLLMRNRLSASSLERIIQLLPKLPIRSTTDRVRSSYSILHRGVLQNDPELVKLAVNTIAATYTQTTGDGIQPDWSYKYHSGILYIGGYGLDLLNFTLSLFPVVQGTPLDFSIDQKRMLDRFLCDGACKVIYADRLDYSTMGRQLIAVGRTMDGFVKHFEALKTVFPEKTAFYQSMIDGIIRQKVQPMAFDTHFWNSDFHVFRRPQFYTSVHCCSNRTKGMESLNHENLKGMWTPFGMNLIFTRGDEYKDIFPVWDWNRLPGLTNPYSLEPGISDISQKTQFVGGVSTGSQGIATMDFDYRDTQAKKTWFFFDQEWIALGAGVRSTHPAPVASTINQCLLKGNVWADGQQLAQASVVLPRSRWIFHDSIGYISLDHDVFTLKAETQKGTLRQIYAFGSDSLIEKGVFTLFIDHGVKPQNASYQYMVLPACSREQLQVYSQKVPVNVLSNTSLVQAVAYPAKGLVGIVFHQAGSLAIDQDTYVQAEQACALMLQRNAEGFDAWISDPSAGLASLRIKIKQKRKTMEQKVDLPQGGEAGRSVRLVFNSSK